MNLCHDATTMGYKNEEVNVMLQQILTLEVQVPLPEVCEVARNLGLEDHGLGYTYIIRRHRAHH